MATPSRLSIRRLIAPVATIAALAVAGSAAAAPADQVVGGTLLLRTGAFRALDAPGDALADPGATAHVSVNNRRQLFGSYTDAASNTHGFLRDRDGSYTRIDVPDAVFTLATDGNDDGQVVGFYADAQQHFHGFLWDDGVVTRIDVPGASATVVAGIDNRRRIVGGYSDASGNDHAFVLRRGRVKTIDPPGADANTTATDINDDGQVVGFYADAGGTYHGFLHHRRSFTTLDPPGAADVPEAATTAPFGINNAGKIAGQYVDAQGVLHGYVRSRRGRYRTIGQPGTVAADINDRGDIVLPAPGSFLKGRAVPVGGRGTRAGAPRRTSAQ